eukprot:5726670-Pleurochrysis_carterae.AAC.1
MKSSYCVEAPHYWSHGSLRSPACHSSSHTTTMHPTDYRTDDGIHPSASRQTFEFQRTLYGVCAKVAVCKCRLRRKTHCSSGGHSAAVSPSPLTPPSPLRPFPPLSSLLLPWAASQDEAAAAKGQDRRRIRRIKPSAAHKAAGSTPPSRLTAAASVAPLRILLRGQRHRRPRTTRRPWRRRHTPRAAA